MDDHMSTFGIFVISFCCLLAFCALIGGISYWVYENNLPDTVKQSKIDACQHEENVDVRVLCLALIK